MKLGSVSKNDDPEKLEKSGVKLFRMQGFELPLVEGCAASIEASVLGSVNEYLEESAALHHCCFASEYYLKPNSLCLSARVNGERTETVELSLIDFRVLQSRGLCNGNTPYHDRILRLVESNANLFRRQLGA